MTNSSTEKGTFFLTLSFPSPPLSYTSVLPSSLQMSSVPSWSPGALPPVPSLSRFLFPLPGCPASQVTAAGGWGSPCNDERSVVGAQRTKEVISPPPHSVLPGQRRGAQAQPRKGRRPLCPGKRRCGNPGQCLQQNCLRCQGCCCLAQPEEALQLSM